MCIHVNIGLVNLKSIFSDTLYVKVKKKWKGTKNQLYLHSFPRAL